MSTLNVNRIESADGTAILVPAGYNLEVDGAILNSGTLPPSPAGQSGKFLYTPDGTALSWSVAGPKSIQQFTASGTWTKPPGISKILVTVSYTHLTLPTICSV